MDEAYSLAVHSQLGVAVGQGWKIPQDCDGIGTQDLPIRILKR